MTIPTNPIEPFTPFLPVTYDIPNEADRLHNFLEEEFANFADVINDKKIGAYTQNAESINGEKWAYDTTKKTRGAYQTIARIKSFVPQTIPMPIGDINPQWIISHAWGSASKPCSAVGAIGAGSGDYFSFYGQGDSRISFTMSNTTITITTDGLRAGYQGFIIIEYIRDGV